MGDKHLVRFEPVGIEIEVDEDTTILRAAAEQGIMLMHGCKEGQCASCKSFILDGDDVEHDRYSTFALPDYEKDEGFTLLCRAHAYEDLTIELLNYDEEMIHSGLPIESAVVEVVSNDNVTHDMRHLVVKLVEPASIKFFPGQYVDFAVPGTDETRSFSMANISTLENGQLEFVIKVYPEGLFSNFLDTRVAAGDRLDVTGPFGVFTLRDNPGADLVFVGGGAGMAPILALLRSMADRGIDRKATFYYGARRGRGRRLGRGDRADHRGAASPRTRPGRRRRLRLRTAAHGGGGTRVAAGAGRRRPAHLLRQVHDDRREHMTSTQERSVPKVVFTDAEAGAKEFPDSGARAFNYFTPAKRKQSHYEDVTVEVQPDPRHYLAQGWLYGFADGKGGYPLEWTALKAWGSDRPEPERGPGSGGQGYPWPALGWHEFRDPNEEWELTLYRYNANVVRQLNQNIEAARQAKAFEQWKTNWVDFVARHVGAWMHVDHGLGLYLFANANRRAPTNMHNNAISVNSMHRIRAAQDLALYNLTLSEEIDGFDGTAHLATWNSDPAWQGVRGTAEQLTAIWDWCEAIFAANIVFEPLVGEVFRSGLVQQAAPANGDFITPTLIGAEEYDYAERDLRYTKPMFQLLINDKEFAEHNRPILQSWLATWVPRCITAVRTLQPIWSQSDAKPHRFEDALDRAKNRFADIVADLDLQTPKELSQ